jgi:peptidoglycan biosynthesis protein MviN/MurJ (putative lipid II flippase)
MFFLLAAQVPRNLHSISWQLLFATHKQKSLTFLICAEAAVNVSLALWLVRYGTVGLAIATFVPMFVSHVLVLPLLLRRLTGVSIRRYWREGVTRPALVAFAIALLGLPLRSAIPPTSIPILLLDGAILAGIGLLLGVVFVAYPEHRRMAMVRVRDIIARKRSVAASVELN